MIRINLMPREERVRKRKLPVMRVPAVGAAVPFVVVGAVVGALAVVGTVQQRDVQKIESEIVSLRLESESYKPQLERIRQITQKRQEVGNRLDIISRLDQQRYFRVKLLDQLSRSTPDNLWISKFNEQNGNSFALEGVTFSNFIVARFMQDLESQPQFQGVELNVVQKGNIDKYDVVQFGLVTGAQP